MDVWVVYRFNEFDQEVYFLGVFMTRETARAAMAASEEDWELQNVSVMDYKKNSLISLNEST